MNATYILLIEDDALVSRTIERSLRGEDFKVALATEGVAGLKSARKRPPHLVILDVVMPGMDGYAVCRELRADPQLAEVPVLFLTAKIKDEDKIAGFRAGADDYLTKPFNVDELRLRVHAILRRARRQAFAPSDGPALQTLAAGQLSAGARQAKQQIQSRAKTPPLDQCLVVGEHVLDPLTFELHTPQRGQVRLTPVQYDLVYHLMSHPGQIFTPGRLLDEVWDYPIDTGSPDLVRVHIKNLRERVEADPGAPDFIRTVPGYGYTVGRIEEQA